MTFYGTEFEFQVLLVGHMEKS